jgi:hypothetical protein
MIVVRLIHDLCYRPDSQALQAAWTQIVVAAGTASNGALPTARPWHWPPSSAGL